jgi:hypothetical protein
MAKRRRSKSQIEAHEMEYDPSSLFPSEHASAHHDKPTTYHGMVHGHDIIPGSSRSRSSKIDIRTAKAVFNALSKANKNDGTPDKKVRGQWKKDKCTTSKKIFKNGPTIAWAKNTAIGDVPGIDAPGQCSTRIVKGKRVTTCSIPKGSKYAKVCSPKARKPATKKRKSKGKKR